MSVPDAVRHASPQVIFEEYPVVGYNYRMTDIQAAIGREQLKRLPAIVARRRELAARYEAAAAVDRRRRRRRASRSGRAATGRATRFASARGSISATFMQRMLDAGISTRRGVMNVAPRSRRIRLDTWRAGSGLSRSEEAQDTADRPAAVPPTDRRRSGQGRSTRIGTRSSSITDDFHPDAGVQRGGQPAGAVRAPRRDDARVGGDWEWIIVDDHSRDETFAVIEALALRDARVRGFRLARNSGSHVAITCGLHHVDGRRGGDDGGRPAGPARDTRRRWSREWRQGAQVVWATRRVQPGDRRTADSPRSITGSCGGWSG